MTNADELSPAEVLEVYRYQPNLERRNHMLKGPQAVAPVFIEHPHRIEAILLCHFLAMLAEALIEREIRTSMKAQDLSGIPLYPELRNCPSPSAAPDLGDLRRRPASPPHEQRRGRAGLRPRAHGAPAAGPRPSPRPASVYASSSDS